LPSKRALLNVVLDDGSESIRAVMFSDIIEKIGLNLQENFLVEKQKLLGRESWFSGSVRVNKLFNNPEFFINGIEEINLDEIIAGMEKAS